MNVGRHLPTPPDGLLLLFFNTYSGVYCRNVVFVGKQRVDVELLDLGNVRSHLRQLDQHQRHRRIVGGYGKAA